MPTISQNLSVPAGLANGQIIDAAQITPLYNALNAFVIPATVGGFQQALVDTAVDVIATGASKDYNFTATKDKAVIFAVSFNWSSSTAATLQFRLNASPITAGVVLGTATTGAGLAFGVIGGHDATFQKPVLIFLKADDTTFSTIAANTTLPNADSSSFGVTAGGAGATVTVGYKLVMAQG